MRRSILLICVLGLALVGCTASAERRPVSLRERWAPDGSLQGEVAYVLETGVGRSALYVMDISTGKQVRLPSPGEYLNSPEWSPDGQTLAFSATDENDWAQLWVSAPDGTDAVQITKGLAANDYPAFTPDGENIIFSSTRGVHGRWHLFSVPVEGGKPVRLTDGDSDDVHPAVSPDGTTVVFSRKLAEGNDGYHLAMLDLATGEVESITGGLGEDMFPSYSPDGETIVFASTRRDNIWQLFTYDVASGRMKRLVGSDSVDRYPVYSPDGNFVLLATDHLAVYPADGKTLPGGDLRWRITEDPGLAPAWR